MVNGFKTNLNFLLVEYKRDDRYERVLSKLIQIQQFANLSVNHFKYVSKWIDINIAIKKFLIN